jgi:hypothetical protein
MTIGYQTERVLAKDGKEGRRMGIGFGFDTLN